ncbi:Ig domain-containing protein [Leucobacter musarum]|uniref:Ig domain-containing protein n=1 Tax=Leucobacter musarum TaxID=1930747 RepID=UPI0006A763BD|nr:Ig domain-containing protein [Leucobacter musarum]
MNTLWGAPHVGARNTRSRGRRSIAILAASAVAFSGLVLGAASPAAAAVENVQFETPSSTIVQLGSLASRSQRGPVAISGIGPYTVRGTDAVSGEPYEFVTDWNYQATNAGWQYESDERPGSQLTLTSNTNASFQGRNGALQLGSNGGCTGSNFFDGKTTYCSAFGPEVYSKPFTASVGQAVSFDWAAQNVVDDYEVYAFLVKVDGTGFGTAADHTLIAYGRGNTQGWTTSSKKIPADGTYRFRFVNGTYDQTGGQAIGSNMYIANVLKLGTENPITFGQLSDRVAADGQLTLSATAPAGAVTYTSTTTNICTVSGSTVSFTGTVGTCRIVANQAGDADYVPAESVTQSFRVLAARTAPVNAGLPFVNGTAAEGQTLTADEGTWLDGGSPITGTAFQWTQTVGGTTTSLSGATAASCYLVESPGSQLRVTVTKTNAIGSTTSSSTPLNGYTCGAPAAPQWTQQALGTPVVGDALSQTFTATGVTKPTYAVTAGTLPAGLTLNATSGVVAGTPTAAGPYAFTLTATNPTGSADLLVSGTVNAAPGAITGGPDDFVVGTAVTGAVAATGTPAPTYSVSAGTLPDGVTLDTVSGALSGTPTVAGPYTFTISATNGVGTAATREYTGTVDQAPGWNVTSGWAPRVGAELDVTFTAAGTPAPGYAVVNGSLPAGLTLDEATGRVTGTPTRAGTYSFTLRATNTRGEADLLVSGTVVEAPGAITGEPGHWIVGTEVTATDDTDTLHATGTPAPAYSVTEGALPAGLKLDPATGLFSGTPTTPGAYDFVVTASNGIGDATTQRFIGIVDAAPVWNTHDAIALQTGVAFSSAFTATGTPAPTYSVAAGTLPAGLALDETTGEITGTPTVPGSYSFSLAASNGIGDDALLELTGIVTDAPVWVDTQIGKLRVGAAFTDAVAASGTPAPTYAVTAGSLPSGLTLNVLTGDITGVPTAAGAYTFTVTASNGIGEAITHEFSGKIVQSPTRPGDAGTPKLPVLREGEPVSVDLSAGIASDPKPTFRVTSGQLPEGLSLDPETGVLSGTPLHPGVYSFIVTVDNGTEEVLTFAFSGEVLAAAAGDADAASGAAANGSQGGAALASTGTELAPVALIGGLLLLAGGVLVARRRRRSA